MSKSFILILFLVLNGICALRAQNLTPSAFDAAPYAISLPTENGLMWEDPREIHSVIVDFAAPIPADAKPRLEYWGSHWPKEHLPKNDELGGGWSGWMELGNWYNGGWRVADSIESISNN